MLSDKNMAVQLEVFIDVGMTRMDTIIQQKYTVSLFLYTFSNFENKLLPKGIIATYGNYYN